VTVISGEYADAARIQRMVDDSGFAAVVAAWPENVGYLSGFYHPDMRVNWERLHLVVWPAHGDPACVVPRMRAAGWDSAARTAFIGPEETAPFVTDVRGYDGEELDMVRAVVDVLQDRGATAGTLGVEYRTLPVKVAFELSRLLPDLTQQDAWPLLNEMRKVKTPAELRQITHVNRLTAETLESVLRTARDGETEADLASRLAAELWRRGAHELSHSVLGAGPRTHGWHPWPGSQRLEDGMLLRTDWGIRIDGYTSDIARNAVVGRASTEQRDTFARISDVHDVVVDAIRPGTVPAELVSLAKRHYERLGVEYRWGLIGHGIGMVIHEEPQLLADVHDPIVEGMTLEIELGYFGTKEGYHIEDLVHVTSSGAVNLTQGDRPRHLIESAV
jgi:Xaa-Pro aminopeptidase